MFSDWFCLSACPVVEITSNGTAKTFVPFYLGYYYLQTGELTNGRVVYTRKNNGTEFYLASAQTGIYQGCWTVTLHLVIIIITTKAEFVCCFTFHNDVEQINICISDFEVWIIRWIFDFGIFSLEQWLYWYWLPRAMPS